MKRTIASLLAGILLATSLPALADRDGHRGWHRPPPPSVHRHHRHHNHHSSGIGWGLAGLALGGVILSTLPPPVVVAPPVVMAPPPPPTQRYWYYCESYRAYYPTVGYCPEGWRALPAY